MKEKKISIQNGMVIAEVTKSTEVSYSVYTKEEWEMGKGLRYPEFEDCSISEAISQAKNY